jgi:hypothetical protein
MTGVYVIAVHHGIVRAEEKHLRKVFGRESPEYYKHVQQYLSSKKLPGFLTGRNEDGYFRVFPADFSSGRGR